MNRVFRSIERTSYLELEIYLTSISGSCGPETLALLSWHLFQTDERTDGPTRRFMYIDVPEISNKIFGTQKRIQVWNYFDLHSILGTYFPVVIQGVI